MNDLKQGYMGVDRRKFPRVNAMVQYKIIEQGSSEKAGSTKDISAGGIAFFTHERIKEGSVLSLSILLPDTTDFIARALVVWNDSVRVSLNPVIRYECGVKFIEIEEENRQKISKYVFLCINID